MFLSLWLHPVLAENAAGLSSVNERCADNARIFLGALNDAQKSQAVWPFDEEKRRAWAYFPNVAQLAVRNEGLKFSDMNETQLVAAHRLMECGLSSQGYQKAAGIIRLDDILAQTDLYREMSGEPDSPVGAQNYWVTIFGEPASSEPWAWQFEGHHLGMNFTAIDNQVVYAPAFMGADPAIVPDGDYAGWRMLGGELDKALQLGQSLTEAQRERAILAAEIPERLFTGPGREASLKEFVGLPVNELSIEQQQLLMSLIDEYVQNGAQPVAAAHLARIENDLLTNTWFAWMGATSADAGIYYRIHSPSLLIEFVTARDRQAKGRPPNPNHVHSMFSDPGNNYGSDMLANHYATHPDHQRAD